MAERAFREDAKKELILDLRINNVSIRDIINMTSEEFANKHLKEIHDTNFLKNAIKYTNKNKDLIARTGMFFASKKGKDNLMTANSLRMTMKKYITQKAQFETDQGEDASATLECLNLFKGYEAKKEEIYIDENSSFDEAINLIAKLKP